MDTFLQYISCIWKIDDIANARLVCKRWREVIDCSGLFTSVQTAIGGTRECVHGVKRLVRSLSNAHLDHRSMENLRMLWETAEDVKPTIDNLPRFSDDITKLIMINNLWIHLSETEQVLSDNFDGSNIDILELGLRRRLQEIKTASHTSVSCIKETKSRDNWLRNFGEHTCFVSWDTFRKNMVDLNNERCLKHARAFLCFPGEDSVSCYAYNLLSCLYGSPRRVWNNFEGVMGNMGFVGMVNSVQATNLLEDIKDIESNNCFVIRYSRMYPEVFAITCINIITGENWHERNVRNNKVIPILNFIAEKKRKGYEVANFFLDENAVTSSAYSWAQRNDYGVRNAYRIRDK